MRRMIEGNEQQNNRNTKIFYKGRYVKYPFENGLFDLPAEDRFFCISEFCQKPDRCRERRGPDPGKLPRMDLLYVR